MIEPNADRRHDQEENVVMNEATPPALDDQFSNATTRQLLTELHARMLRTEHNMHIVWYVEGCCTEALEHLPLNVLDWPASEEQHEGS